MRWQFTNNGPDRATLKRSAILLLIFAMVGLLVVRQVNRWRGTPVDLWVAAADLPPGTVVQGAQLAKRTLREPNLPATVVLDRGLIEGRQLTRAKGAGAPFFRNDFAPPDRGPGLSGVLPEGRVLVLLKLRGLPVDDLAEQLRFGDRLDVVAAGSGGGGTAMVARDAFFLGWIAQRQAAGGEGGSGGLIDSLTAAATQSQAPQGASPLLLGVHPQDAVPLAEAQAAGFALTPVIHGKSEVEKGELLILTRPRFDEIELISGAKRERIPLSRLQLE